TGEYGLIFSIDPNLHSCHGYYDPTSCDGRKSGLDPIFYPVEFGQCLPIGNHPEAVVIQKLGT
ncbi:MAG: hypothetical protein ABIJ65_01445, partial [Chloroflexota bacterium]